jgi:hydrogenase maturation protease
MTTLLIAIGNPLRGDDGAAHEVLRRIAPRDGLVTLSVHQLTPELAPEVARAERVFFIDADVEAESAAIAPVSTASLRTTALAHSLTPGEIVVLAQRLFGFEGTAYLCSIPVSTFEGEDLSAEALAGITGAVTLLETTVGR